MATESDRELVVSTYELFNSGDRELIMERMHPEIEFHELPVIPDAGIYRGHEAFEQFLTKIDEAFEDGIHYQVIEAERGPGGVVVLCTAQGRGASSGLEARLDFYSVWRVSDGMLSHHRATLDRAEARRWGELDE